MTSCSSLKRKTVRTVIFWGLIYFMGIPAFSQTQLTPKFLSSTYKCNFLGADNKQ